MPDITRSQNFENGDLVTAQKLKDLIDLSSINPTFVTGKTELAAQTVATGDHLLIYDLSALAFRKVRAADLVASNLPVRATTVTASTSVSTPEITGPVGVDVVITPPAGRKIDVAGALEADSINAVGAITAGGLVTANLGATIAGPVTASGIANFTNSIQFSGTPVYGLSAVIEGSVNAVNCLGGTAGEISATCNQWLTLATIPSLTKTNKEIWQVDATFSASWSNVTAGQNQCKFRMILVSTGAVLAEKYRLAGPFSGLNFHKDQINLSAIIPASTVLTSDSIRVEIFYNNPYAAGQSAFLRAGPHGDQFETGTTNRTTIIKYIKP